MPLHLDSVEIVLVRPARAANVAAAARAMKNMGLRHLWLVDPPRELDQPEARRLAYGAWDVLDGARRAANLGGAIAQATLVAATSGRIGRDAWDPRRLALEAGRRVGGGRLAVVFGPEACGLTRHELELTHAIVQVPTDPEHPSLNLAQAVLIIAYELRLAILEGRGPVAAERTLATAGALEEALRELQAALLGIGYLNPQNPEAILAELRRLLARAGPTTRELGLLRGLARQVAWAGRVARGRAPVP
jgi:TrmH family RNA methyltransferase